MTGPGVGRILAKLLFLIVIVIAPIGSNSAAAVIQIDLYDGVLPSAESEIRDRTVGELDTYEISVDFDPVAKALSGFARIDFQNSTNGELSEVAFRLYPNAEYYEEAELRIDSVFVAGVEVAADLARDPTVMVVPLRRPLSSGSSIAIEIDFTTVVPTNSTGSFGILSHDLERDTWVLSDWYPIVAGFEEETGWYVEPPTPVGDPTFSEAALYDVTVTVPERYQVVASGSVVDEQVKGPDQANRFVTGPVRDFAMVIDDEFVTAIGESGNSSVKLHTNAPGLDTQKGEIILEQAMGALDHYGSFLGTFPYRELDIVETELASAFGVSWSGIVFLDTSLLLSSPDQIETVLFTLVHEIGHQWFGGIVGVNSNDHSFMNESTTNLMTAIVLADIEGSDRLTGYLRQFVAAPYLVFLQSNPDGIVDIAVADRQNLYSWPVLVYGKGALGLLAIWNSIGRESFFQAFERYVDQFAYDVASPVDLLTTFEVVANKDLDALWEFWFEQANTTASDVESVLFEAELANSAA